MAVIAWMALTWTTGMSAPPKLAYLLPAGGQRGTEVLVTCTGEFTWPPKVATAGIAAVPGEDSGRLRVSIPEDLATDRVWIRLYNDEGCSAAVPFLIGSLKETEEHEPNNSPREAQPISESSVTINGTLQEKGDVDGFAIQLSAGQTLVAAVDAHSRLGSPIDAILQIASVDGTVLSENHDDLGLDPRLAFTASASGTYQVRIFAFPAEPDSTIAYRGSADCIYRLTLTTGPFITHTFPFSVSQAQVEPLRLIGWNIPPDATLPVVALGGSRQGDFQEFEALDDIRYQADTRLGFVWDPTMGGAARVRLVPPEMMSHVSPCSGPTDVLTVPCIIAGCLRAPRQIDTYRVRFPKGQPVVIAVESQRLGLPTLPVVQLIDPTGAVVAEAGKDGAPNDASMTHSAAHDGEYHLNVRDRFRHGGARYLYQLSVQRDRSDFALSAATDSVVVAADKPAELPVTVQRHAGADGAVGRIAIEAIDLPAGITATAVVSEPEGPTAEKVSITLTTTGQAISGPIRLRGSADQPRKLVRFARTPPKYATCSETIWLTSSGVSGD
jgi:hypothetical protein